MPKTTLNTLTHIYVSCLLFISILLLPLMVTQPSISANEQTDDEEVGELIYNHEVVYACAGWLKPDKDQDKTSIQLHKFICGVYLGMVQEQNEYHQSFIEYFTEKEDKEMVDFAGVYELTGCNISSLSHKEFAELYLDFMADNEDIMDYNFYGSLHGTLKPYCNSLRDKNIDFYLNESGDRRRT